MTNAKETVLDLFVEDFKNRSFDLTDREDNNGNHREWIIARSGKFHCKKGPADKDLDGNITLRLTVNQCKFQAKENFEFWMIKLSVLIDQVPSFSTLLDEHGFKAKSFPLEGQMRVQVLKLFKKINCVPDELMEKFFTGINFAQEDTFKFYHRDPKVVKRLVTVSDEKTIKRLSKADTTKLFIPHNKWDIKDFYSNAYILWWLELNSKGAVYVVQPDHWQQVKSSNKLSGRGYYVIIFEEKTDALKCRMRWDDWFEEPGLEDD